MFDDDCEYEPDDIDSPMEEFAVVCPNCGELMDDLGQERTCFSCDYTEEN